MGSIELKKSCEVKRIKKVKLGSRGSKRSSWVQEVQKGQVRFRRGQKGSRRVKEGQEGSRIVKEGHRGLFGIFGLLKVEFLS